jgi:hypothetical protein
MNAKNMKPIILLLSAFFLGHTSCDSKIDQIVGYAASDPSFYRIASSLNLYLFLFVISSP